MSLVPLAVRSTVLVLTFVPRLYRTLLWRILLSVEVPLAVLTGHVDRGSANDARYSLNGRAAG